MEARYANFFNVGYNLAEFILEFGQAYGDPQQATLHTRIIISPRYIGALLDVLTTSVHKYEQSLGPIDGVVPEK